MADFVNASPFGSVLTAMVTPFNADGGVDYGVAEKLADHLITHGSDGLVVCGTTGESPTLSWEEEHELFRVVKQTVGDRGSVIAGTGSNCTREAMEATQIAAKLGVDGSLQVVPYYNKPPQEGLLAHFQAIARCAPELPMMLYNIPGRTGQNLAPETVYRLAEVENIVAIKEATGSLEQASLIRAHTPEDFAIYAGDDVLTLPLLAVGGAGVVSVASHLVGDRLQTMVQNFAQGATAQALEIHLQLIPLFKILFCATNPIPVKTALGLQGWPVGAFRPPLCALSSSHTEQLQAVLRDLALLP
ncbi:MULTISPECIES: 4-hydroxy-tetrahydrodipicolinate synthase [Synechocystis]|uniref:4-hydroxy-tetrahydrodipicolinate synthase n=1 Tax=Synechocystis salina LEGE 00031 TaxID=1828736 RepID=A0ABR9VSI5_9SYNC|nr:MULTISPECIES: 4-hydroxy-tetrahydrodipicolinate synthase [Synechocystis]MBE9194813.1 4-hydroxy-tetrahydrodipicolinate synthase [Synechocystis sp. LEGE 06083]MBE9239911.1 4-hydroxy-tetrahydrodipicolinate synthase [Synechocystis salina LEGE 00041]MBE9253206.1 4-hydroxy-tetrahydrodipicolinate synthase [Synechocystis salina LEGE 00031]